MLGLDVNSIYSKEKKGFSFPYNEMDLNIYILLKTLQNGLF